MMDMDGVIVETQQKLLIFYLDVQNNPQLNLVAELLEEDDVGSYCSANCGQELLLLATWPDCRGHQETATTSQSLVITHTHSLIEIQKYRYLYIYKRLKGVLGATGELAKGWTDQSSYRVI